MSKARHVTDEQTGETDEPCSYGPGLGTLVRRVKRNKPQKDDESADRGWSPNPPRVDQALNFN